jgi:hypothetical protein
MKFIMRKVAVHVGNDSSDSIYIANEETGRGVGVPVLGYIQYLLKAH